MFQNSLTIRGSQHEVFIENSVAGIDKLKWWKFKNIFNTICKYGRHNDLI